ncbi:ubiquitin family protein [Entamoeba histolytica HM-1:IMSS-B]|uniref:Ubiquitin-like domain-containing protein n=6 Tax=Entamoeba histolytica TaxID=5759 RepID=C4M065_ENTH1|nr:hypothetical protein EHI_021540 [Entamoeba histolytica HM-1:IMSS]EMD47165.1 ubiquitin family protein [Entamoeba histolytica KU27]EMH74864.1 ubiquitin family protein [Entamoeba histolytica HM-1:IMSS-B]EMS17440.1 ubiquitin family protein [Entamoeba histolytica HM-3:IMSS]ENY64615.1 ubiquitin family protein, putative [Entamoeba histolytica HM-1:IMSS-A]GAT94538.1 hypothetical protein CL6EHI_021540 [Entamoeba histolytica]|eukprot:XP_649998.1 hypothetical protein EHI_021540 [Entamoeba histolytica HM-1:IMSS]
MRVLITTVSGNTHEIEIEQNQTIKELKQNISDLYQIETPLLHLIYKGKNLKNDKSTLKENEITEGSKITVIKLKTPTYLISKETQAKKEEINFNTTKQEVNDDIMEIEFGDESFEEIVNEIEKEEPELAEEIRDNPELLNIIFEEELKEANEYCKNHMEEISEDTEEENEEEMINYKKELEQLKIEGEVFDKINNKLKNGEELNDLEHSILEEENSYELCIIFILINEGFPENIVREAIKNTSTLDEARTYCKYYLN